ncbi:MAG: hypothetical protein HXS44_01140 [Theionarchaea archaeon]|nr:hypothetical protein [Theionarchaea archaeon]
MIITTSRRPCGRSRKLCKELESVIPLSEYVLRGKKGLRELITLSDEKGSERLVIIASKGDTLSLIFYCGWQVLGELSGSVVLRKELHIPKMRPLSEDVPFLVQSEEEDAEGIAHLFGADQYEGDNAYTFMVYKKGLIDFYRLDISEKTVGPRINIACVNYEGND